MSLRQRVQRNISLKFAGEISSRLVSFAFNLVLARGLGDAGYGRYSYAASFAALIALCGELGLNTYLIREVARDRANAPAFLRAFAPLRLLSVSLVAGLTALLALALEPGRVPEIALMTVFMGINTLLDYQSCLLSAFEQMGHDAGLRLTTRLLVSTSGIAAVLLGAPLLVVIAAVTAANLLALAVGELWRRRIGYVFGMTWAPRQMARFLVASLPVGLAAFAMSAFFYMDNVVLGALGFADAAIGQYSAALKILEAAQALPLVVVGGIFPIAAQLARTGDRAALAPFFTRVTRLCLLVGAPLAVAGAVLSPAVARLLYGAEYVETGPALAVLALAAPLFFSNLILSHLFIATGDHWFAAATRGAAMLVKAGAMVVGCRRLGVVGASYALLATDFVLFAFLFAHRRRRGLSESGEGRLIALTAASAAGSLAIWRLVGDQHLIVRAVAVALPFALSLVAEFRLRRTPGDPSQGTIRTT